MKTYHYEMVNGKGGELKAESDKEAITRIEARCDLSGSKPVVIYREENDNLFEVKNYNVPVNV